MVIVYYIRYSLKTNIFAFFIEHRVLIVTRHKSVRKIKSSNKDKKTVKPFVLYFLIEFHPHNAFF